MQQEGNEELDEEKKGIEQSRRAFIKNLIHPLPMQDCKGPYFQRPSLLFAGARRRLGWSNPDDIAGGCKTLNAIAWW